MIQSLQNLQGILFSLFSTIIKIYHWPPRSNWKLWPFLCLSRSLNKCSTMKLECDLRGQRSFRHCAKNFVKVIILAYKLWIIDFLIWPQRSNLTSEFKGYFGNKMHIWPCSLNAIFCSDVFKGLWAISYILHAFTVSLAMT